MTRILFLCTGNSCRSQMAEGWARVLLGDDVEVRSAGLEAHGLNPDAIRVMAEAGIDISGQTSDVVSAEDVAGADIVVTVCGHADEHCPVVPARVRKYHWPLPDPAKLTGSREAILAGFRSVRDEIRTRVVGLGETIRPPN